jgi:hypothetical protein
MSQVHLITHLLGDHQVVDLILVRMVPPGFLPLPLTGPLSPQDLAVVVLLMLIPLLAPTPDASSGGMAAIAKALGTAAVKVCQPVS